MFKLKSNVNYTVNYLPTKRCRNERTLRMVKTTDFYINEVTLADAPVAFKVTQFDDFYPCATKDGYATRPIHLYHGSLYKEYVVNKSNANEHSHFLEFG